MIERRNHLGVVKGKGYVTQILYIEDFNDFELARTEKENTDWDNSLGYLYNELSPWISENILLNAKKLFVNLFFSQEELLVKNSGNI